MLHSVKLFKLDTNDAICIKVKKKKRKEKSKQILYSIWSNLCLVGYDNVYLLEHGQVLLN